MFKTNNFNNLGGKVVKKKLFLFSSSHTNIRNAIFYQRSPQPPEVDFLGWRRRTNIQTNNLTDRWTWRLLINSAQKAKLVKILEVLQTLYVNATCQSYMDQLVQYCKLLVQSFATYVTKIPHMGDTNSINLPE